MKIKSLAVAWALAAGISAQAANNSYYFDLNGTDLGGGVTNGGSYLWNTTDVFWNDIKAGDDGAGLGTLTTWLDCDGLGTTPGSTAANANANIANFSAGTAGSNYTVTIPEGELRDFRYLIANKDHVTLSGMIRPQGGGFVGNGFRAISPGSLTFSNLTVLVTNCSFTQLGDGGSYNGRYLFTPAVNVGFKQWWIDGYTTADFGNLLDNNLMFTNYPGGGSIACIFFNGYKDNQVLQGSGSMALPLGNWTTQTDGPFPKLCWARDGYGNGQGGGFAARGGKLTVNLFGDSRTLAWNPKGARNSLTNWFCGEPFSLQLGSFTADSEVEFKNGIDLNGCAVQFKVLTSTLPGSFGRVSGALTDTFGGGSVIKVGQNGYQASGTLVLSGANTYSGPTINQEGKLVLTSAHQGGGAIIVSNNATLGARITSSAAIPTAGLTLGQSGDKAANLEFDFAALSSVAALRATNFTVLGTNLSIITITGAPQMGLNMLVKYNGAIGGNGFAGFTLAPLPAGYDGGLVDNAGSLDLNITTVPVPSSVNITNILVTGGTVTVDFVAGATDSAASFTLQRSGNAASGYGDDTGASITGTAPNFRSTTTTNGDQQFYRLRR